MINKFETIEAGKCLMDQLTKGISIFDYMRIKKLVKGGTLFLERFYEETSAEHKDFYNQFAKLLLDYKFFIKEGYNVSKVAYLLQENIEKLTRQLDTLLVCEDFCLMQLNEKQAL